MARLEHYYGEVLNESRYHLVYFDGSNTTNKILDVLEEKRPKIIAIDELEMRDHKKSCKIGR